MDEAGEPVTRSDPAPGDRLEELEQQVRRLTSRLAGWVEAQLVQALEDRRDDMKALRSELHVVVNEQLAGIRAESTSMLTVATRRLDVAQERLSERLDTVAERAADAAARAIALTSATSTEAERTEVLSQELGRRLAALHDQLEARLAASGDRQRGEIEGLRAEVQAELATALAGFPDPFAGEALELRLRSAMSRLSESVEAQLASMGAELAAAVDEPVSQAGSRSATTLAAVQDRLTAVSTSLGDRVDDAVRQAASAAEGVAALEAEAGPARVEAFEQRVKSAMGRLTETVEARIADLSTARQADHDALRSQLTAVVDERIAHAGSAWATTLAVAQDRMTEVSTGLGLGLEAAARQAAAAAEGVAAVTAGSEAGTARVEAFEQRVKAAMGRITDSVETRLAESATSRQSELDALRSELEKALGQQSADLRAEIAAGPAALRSGFAHAQARLDTLEQQRRDDGERLGGVVEAKLHEVVERRRAELEELTSALQEALAAQLSDARREVGTAVSEAHRRFLLSVEELDERMNVVSELAVAAIAQLGTLNETAGSEGVRIDALEHHTRGTDAHLADLVEAKLSELAGQRAAELDSFRGQTRAALDAHLADTRAEVTSALGDGREEVLAAEARLEDRRSALDRHAEDAVATLDALGASVAAALRDAEARLDQAVQARLAELEAVAAQVVDAGAETAGTVASLDRKSVRAQDRVKRKLASLAEQVEALAAAVAEAAAAAKTTEGSALAPLRSDMRMLQDQMAELAGAVAELGPRRRAPATPVAVKALKAAKAAKRPAARSATRGRTAQ